jgi:hypothetical protein
MRVVEDQSAPIPEEEQASLEGACISFDARGKGPPRPLPLKGGVGNWKTLVGRGQWEATSPPSWRRMEEMEAWVQGSKR